MMMKYFNLKTIGLVWVVGLVYTLAIWNTQVIFSNSIYQSGSCRVIRERHLTLAEAKVMVKEAFEEVRETLRPQFEELGLKQPALPLGYLECFAQILTYDIPDIGIEKIKLFLGTIGENFDLIRASEPIRRGLADVSHAHEKLQQIYEQYESLIKEKLTLEEFEERLYWASGLREEERESFKNTFMQFFCLIVLKELPANREEDPVLIFHEGLHLITHSISPHFVWIIDDGIPELFTFEIFGRGPWVNYEAISILKDEVIPIIGREALLTSYFTRDYEILKPHLGEKPVELLKLQQIAQLVHKIRQKTEGSPYNLIVQKIFKEETVRQLLNFHDFRSYYWKYPDAVFYYILTYRNSDGKLKELREALLDFIYGREFEPL
jgi:hypothetical protein